MKRLLLKLINLMGFRIEKISKEDSDSRKVFLKDNVYEKVTPYATYSPWLLDKGFENTYNCIKNNTLVDKYRCYELWYLLKQLTHLEGDCLEVGVWRGGTGALIAHRLHDLQDDVKVYLADTFEGIVKSSDYDKDYNDGEHNDTSEQIVHTLLNDLNISNTIIIKGVFPEDSSKLIPSNNIKFCHIDVDVYQSASDIVNWLWDRLCIGGVIVYDDYGFDTCSGITKFVEEQMNRTDCMIIHNLNGHAIQIKLK